MPTTLISLISTQLGFLWDPAAVELTDLDESFGVRRTDTGEVVVPAGTPLDNPQSGLWTYEFESAAGYLECCLKVTPASDGSESESESEDNGPIYLTFYRYVPAEPVPEDSQSESDSEADAGSDSADVLARGISLTRGALTRESVDGPAVGQTHDMFRLSFTTSDPSLMPGDIFTYLRGPVDPREGREPNEYFQFVATPYDATVYPVGAPEETQLPGFYRTNTVDFLVPSSAAAEQLEADLLAELAGTKAAYDRLDTLEPLGEILITGSGTVEDVADADPVCETYTFETGEQLALVVAELEAAFG